MDIGKIAHLLRDSIKKKKGKEFISSHKSEIEASLEEYIQIPEDKKLHALHQSYRSIISTKQLSGYPEDAKHQEAYIRHYDEFIHNFSKKKPHNPKEISLAIDAYARIDVIENKNHLFKKEDKKEKRA